MSQRIGRCRPFWVQGPGGNASVKIRLKGKDALYIKPSGARLWEITGSDSLACVDLRRFRDALRNCRGAGPEGERAYAKTLSDSAGAGTKKPSMETGFHATLKMKWVIPFHLLAVIAMGFHARRQRTPFAKWMESRWKKPYKVIEACSPGLELTRRLARFPSIPLILLENHGVILQGMNTGILKRWEKLEDEFCRDWKNQDLLPRTKPQTPYERRPTPIRIYIPDTAVFLDRLRQRLRSRGKGKFVLSPDAWSVDLDVSEIWHATDILYGCLPDLPEIPVEISSSVAQLPTEIFRRSLFKAASRH